MATTTSMAAPSLFPRDGNRLASVVNRTNSTILGDHAQADNIYVLPPASGTATPRDFRSFSANVGFCSNMKSLQAGMRRLDSIMLAKNEEALELEDDLDQALAELNAAKTEGSQLVASDEGLKQIKSLTQRVSEIEARLDSLFEQLQNCQSNCQELIAERQDLLQEKRDKNRELATLRSENRVAYQNYQRAMNKIEAKQSAYDGILENQTRKLQAIQNARQSIMNAIGTYAELHGGYAMIEYDSGWSANVAKIAADNAGAFNVQKIFTQKAALDIGFAPASSQDSYLRQMNPILGYSVAGMDFVPGTGTAVKLLPALPERFSAALNLNLIGACPILHPNDYGLKKDSVGIPEFGVTARYQFPTMMMMRARFSYNLYHFHEEMRSSGTSGGFFTSRSWSKLETKDIKTAAFKAHWETEDPDNRIPAEQRKKTEDEMRILLTERVLKELYEPAKNVTVGAPPPLPTGGALVIADGLEKSCGWYSYYCTGGAFVLRAAFAIWGSGEAHSDFKQTYDNTASEELRVDEVVYKDAVTVFSRQASNPTRGR